MESLFSTFSSQSMPRDRVSSARLWRVSTLVAVLANVAWNYLSDHIAFGVGNISAVSAKYDNAFTPAPYAFAIWGLIYASFIGYSVYALLPSQRDVAIHDGLSRPLVAVNIMASVWIIAFKFEALLLGTGIMIAMLAAGWTLFTRSRDQEATPPLPDLWHAPFSLFFAWIVVANLANLVSTAIFLGWESQQGQNTAAVALLMVTVCFAFLAVMQFHTIVVPLVICWSLVAIVVADWTQAPLVAAIAAVLAVAVAGLTIFVAARRSKPLLQTTHHAPSHVALADRAWVGRGAHRR